MQSVRHVARSGSLDVGSTGDPMNSQSVSRSALSLVEVMIAMVILVIGLSTLFDSMVTSKRVNDRATNQAKAYEEIQAQIESLQYLDGVSFSTDELLVG